MSRIGRMPIAIPAGVTVDIAENNKVTVKGQRVLLREYYQQRWRLRKKGKKSLFQGQMTLRR